MNRKTNSKLMVVKVLSIMVAVFALTACGYFESEEAKLAQAQEYIKQGDNNSAAIVLKKILQSNGNNGEARFLLGKIEFSRYRLSDAIDSFKKAKTSRYSSDELFFYWVKALMYKAEYDRLDELYQDEYFSAARNSADGVMLEGDYFALKNNYNSAKKFFDKHYALTGNKAVKCLSDVKLLSIKNDHIAAIAQSEACEKKYSADPDFQSNLNLYLRALSSLATKDSQSAQAGLDKLITSYRDESDLHIKLQSSLLLIKLYLLDGKLKEAASLADSALAYIYHPDLFYAKAVAATQDRNYSVAEQMHLKALAMLPEYKPSLMEMVKLKYMQGNTEQAKYYAGKVHGGKNSAFLLDKIDQMEAIKSYQQGDFNSVIESLSGEGGNKNIKSKIILALAYAKKNDRKNMWQTYEKISEQLNSQSQKELLKARLYSELGEFSDAEKIYKKQVNENSLVAMLAISELYMKTGQYSQAEDMLSKAVATKKNNKQVALLLVRFYDVTGNKEKLYAFLQNSIKETSDLEYKILLAKTYFKYGQYNDALVLGKEIIKSDQNNFDAYVILANVYAKEKKYNDAQAMLTKAANIKPDYLQIYLFMARLAYLNSDLDSSQGYLATALSKNPEYMPALSATIDLYLEQDKKEEAIKFANTARVRLSNKKSGLLLLATAYKKIDDDENALKQFKAALKEDDSDTKLALLVYELSVKVAGADVAEKELSNWLLASGKIENYLVVAEYALKEKQYALAEKYYQYYHGRNATNPIVLNNLSWLYMEKGDNEQALTYAREALKLSPLSPEIHDSVGWLLVKLGKHDEAEPYLIEAQTKLSRNPSVNYHLAMLYYALNKKTQSKHYLGLTEGLNFPEQQEAQALLKKL